MSRGLPTIILILACGASATPVAAQTKNRIAVGVGVAGKLATGDEADGTYGPGVMWRFGTAKEGWNIKYGLNWYKAEISRNIGNEVQAFGRLRIRPVMVGYGYTHLLGRGASVSGNLLGGYAFNSFAVHDNAVSALRTSLGTTSIVTDVANAFVLKPEISLWKNVSDKIGVNFNVGYIVSRPFVTVEASGSQQRQRIHADALTMSFGIVYSVF